MGKLLSIQDIKNLLERRGFFHVKQSVSDGKVMRFNHELKIYPVYLKQSLSLNPTQKTPLIIHPSFSHKLAELRAIDGVFLASTFWPSIATWRRFLKK